MNATIIFRAALVPVLALAACGGAPEKTPPDVASVINGTSVAVLDTTVAAQFEASGVAAPMAEATLSTKLMGTVTAVLVTEGTRVAAGTPLVRIDASDLDAKGVQADAGIAAAEAAFGEATAQATRIRALYADSAAPRAQLDAVEAGLARARAGLDAARAGKAELSAVKGYGVVRAPFAGVVTHRFADVGDFAAPGAPLVTVQDVSRLRVEASIPASYAAAVKRGSVLRVRVEGIDARATVEGVVPSAGAMYTVNAIVAN
ncbi:MAG: efflux RND transporter periplasmic adaptor subunit, partial [Gemmatimonadaceae bacterium]